MGQPVKLSDELIVEARIAGASMQRSIAGQVEFWARLGKAMERLMRGGEVERMRAKSTAKSLSQSLETINQPLGRARLAAYLDQRSFPRFVAAPQGSRLMIREDADGSRTLGRFEGRNFVPQLETAEAVA